MLNKISRLFRAEKEYVAYQHLHLPNFRTNQALSDNEAYIQSGVEQVHYLTDHNLLDAHTRLLDFGCGQGRLLNALMYNQQSFAHYTGIDTSKKSIEWDITHLSYKPAISFIHLPAYNARYNTHAAGLATLPFGSSSFDLIFLNSVFSHMLAEDVSFYLKEFYRVMDPQAHIYLTAFIEENVPDVVENPQGYLEKSTGALHRVRYEKSFFFNLVHQAGLKVVQFDHQGITRTGQSIIVAKRNNKA